MKKLFNKDIIKNLKSTQLYKNFIESLRYAPLYDSLDMAERFLNDSNKKSIKNN